jgi:hypothetical protein
MQTRSNAVVCYFSDRELKHVQERADRELSVSGVLPPSCGGRHSSEDANGVDRIGSHLWSTI